MKTIDALNYRYCCRAFKPEQVSKEKVQKILEAAIRAPSWANTQPWEIYVASGELLERLRKAYLMNREKGVPGNPDLPRPQSWPPALQKRTEELMSKREEVLLSISEMGHFLNRTLWDNQAALTSSLRPRL